MATKYTVTDSKGQLHKRTSKDRTYSHAVVTHYAAIPASGDFLGCPARSTCEWAGRLDLAQKVASRNKGTRYFEGVEIIPAVIAAR